MTESFADDLKAAGGSIHLSHEVVAFSSPGITYSPKAMAHDASDTEVRA